SATATMTAVMPVTWQSLRQPLSWSRSRESNSGVRPYERQLSPHCTARIGVTEDRGAFHVATDA
ncbi:MAG: hypothetical protein QOI23_652, partial [Chloroflexota bacterium]|nr:hypothetical protein [Chloroflexota bacterium]